MPLLGILLLLAVALAASAGVAAVGRAVPPERRKANNDAVGFVFAQVGVVYAVVLAMVVVGVWEARSRAHENTYTETNALLQIAWYSRTLPKAEGDRLAGLTERYTTRVIRDEWPLLAEQRDDPVAWRQFTEIRALINEREPATGADEVRYDGALAAVAQLGDARRERVNEAATAGVPLLLWAALLIGALVTLAFVYLFGMESLRTHTLVVFALALTMGVMLLIVYEFDYPFSGPLKVGPTAFELALERMRQIT